MLIPCDEVNILNTFGVMIILRLLLLLTSNLHLKLLSTQGTGADKLLSTQRVNKTSDSHHRTRSQESEFPECTTKNLNVLCLLFK